MTQLPEFTGPAGAAFLLSEPALMSIEFDHPEGRVIVREGAANVTVNLLNSYGVGDVKAVAWRVIQESFDLLAARRRAALSTALGDLQCLLWSRNRNRYDLTCVVTFESGWSISVEGTVGGAVQARSQQTFTRHDSLRFYRMSQCARGLFDAYRNAYLALECILSDITPKREVRHYKRGKEWVDREEEMKWLMRAAKDLPAEVIPSGIDVMPTLQKIYEEGRNPLFHAKIGESVYPPQSSQREEVQALFERLTLLLVSLLQYRFGTEVVSRWATMSRSAQDAATGVKFDFDEVSFEHGAGEISVSPTIEVIDSPRRFGQLWAKVFVVRPKELLTMKRVQFLRESKWMMSVELDETVEISKVGSVTFEINSVLRNLRAPRVYHPE
jgi:hypothetical protein